MIGHLRDLPEPKQQFFQDEKPNFFSTPARDLVILKKDPLFQKAWQFANAKQKIKIKRLANEAFSFNGKKILQNGADYNSTLHEIRLCKTAPFAEAIHLLVFETMNAVQRESCIEIDKLAKAGELSREELALLKERVEYNSSQWCNLIIESLTGCPLPKETFSEFLSREGAPSYYEGSISHTDGYRHVWDRSYSARYLEKHPELLKNYRL